MTTPRPDEAKARLAEIELALEPLGDYRPAAPLMHALLRDVRSGMVSQAALQTALAELVRVWPPGTGIEAVEFFLHHLALPDLRRAVESHLLPSASIRQRDLASSVIRTVDHWDSVDDEMWSDSGPSGSPGPGERSQRHKLESTTYAILGLGKRKP